MPRRGLFLDLDGTLADSLPTMRSVYYAFLEEYGFAGSETEFQRLNGPPLRRICEILRETHGLTDPVDVLYARYHAMLDAARNRIAPATGAREVLERAKANGWTVAVVTSSLRATTGDWLAKHGLESLVDTVVGGEDASRGKPNPEPYQLTLRLSGCDPMRSLAVEDSVQGALSASGALLPTWVIGPTLPVELINQPQICGCLPNFTAITGLL